MTPQTILYVIVAILVFSYVFSWTLDYLNLKAQHREIPPEIANFYNREKYLLSLDYHREQTRFGFITGGLSASLTLLMLVFGGFGLLDMWLREFFHNEIALALIFFGVLALGSDVITFPLQWYETFVLEDRFGFNKTTPRTFFLDKLKGYFLGALLGGTLMATLIFLIQKIGPAFWIWFGLLAALVLLTVNMFYTSLILPLFNKLTPLPDGEAKDAIRQFAQHVSFPLDGIFVMDGSRRSAKANAFFSGIGRKKKIILYDTMIANHTTPELVAVLAHEVGHFKKKHIVWSYVLSILQIIFTLFVLSRMVFQDNLSFALGGHEQGIHLNLLAFGILFSPISGITGLMMSLYSRRNEFEADAYARDSCNGRALADALKKLSVDNLSNLYPHPLYVFFHYSHPPLLKRLQAIQS